MKVKKLRKLTSWQFIAIGYLAVILMGCFLLTLPLSTRSGEWTPVLDSLFTAVSATCVTGLSLFDTYVHWSGFGQVVILLLIQVGGVGFMTIITLFALLIKKQIGIYERRILIQSSGSVRTTGVIKLIRRILIWTAIFESVGALILAIRFCGDFGFWKGIYYAIFHSVSAFCNAGFDIMGVLGAGVSLTPYATDPLVSLTVIVLIVIGGLGFIVWSDLYDNRFNIKKCTLHTKIVIVISAVLVAAGTALFYLLEHNGVLSGLNGGQALLVSLFQSVTSRTAGFMTVPMSQLSDSSRLLICTLMFIGGSTGSTAGGIKTTTFVVIIFGIAATARGTTDIRIGKRRLDFSMLSQACTILATYLFAVVMCSIVICEVEHLALSDVLFECVSAIATCGLSVGITASLSATSKILLMLLMYIGRVGIITLALAFFEKRANPPIQRPIDKIHIG